MFYKFEMTGMIQIITNYCSAICIVNLLVKEVYILLFFFFYNNFAVYAYTDSDIQVDSLIVLYMQAR